MSIFTYSHIRQRFLIGLLCVANVFWIAYGHMSAPELQTSMWLFIPALILFIMGILRIDRWCKHAFRETILSTAVLGTALFLYSADDNKVLALTGAILWYSITPRYKRNVFDTILLLVIFLSALTPYRLLYTIILGVVYLKSNIELIAQEHRDFSLPLEAERPGRINNSINEAMGKFLYHFFFAAWYLISCLPLCVLYAFSSILASILFLVRFRYKVVHKNIKESFPDKSATEILNVERQYYLHFCDLMFESIKYFSISEKEMRKRMVYKNLEQARQSLKNGKTIGLYMGHYANWEWVSSIPLVVGDISQCCQLYHPLQNMVFDRLVAYTRERWGGVNIPANESIRHIIKLKQQGKPLVIGFIADQVPLWQNIHYWTHFLNHPDTPVFTGAERLMKKLNMDVYYLDVRKVKRGYYEAEFKLISTTPNECAEFQLTEDYTRMLEQTINEAPPYWLWSHRRWKRTREEFNQLFPNGRK